MSEWSDDNILLPETLSMNSGTRVWWTCEKKHSWESSPNTRTSMKTGCPYCSNRRILVGYNDLATTQPELVKYWNDPGVEPTQVTAGSKKSVLWECDYGHEYLSPIRKQVAKRSCTVCSGHTVITGVNDIGTLKPSLADEWNDPNPITMYGKGNPYKASWRCIQDHEWSATVASRVAGAGCPYCSGRYAVPGSTDLESRFPELSAEWGEENDLEPSEVTYQSNKKTWWRCPNGHQNYLAAVSDRTRKTKATGCPQCAHLVSRAEVELGDWIETLGFRVERSNRTLIAPKELDIYIPELKIAIEFNGIYWHSEKFRSRNYHAEKLEDCDMARIRLIQVWSDDWEFRQDLVKRMLKHKLGVSTDEKVYARKTSVTEIVYAEAKPFLEKNHIQGTATGYKYVGLEHGGELVAVGVFKKISKNTAELARYATSKHVVGGLGKIVASMSEEVDIITTFADHEISNGDAYLKSGWLPVATIEPDYKYVQDGERKHKFNFRKEKFKSNPELKHVEGLTETQLAKLNGILKVWDSGKTKFEYRFR